MRTEDLRYLFFTLNVWLCLTSVVMVVISAIALAVPLRAVEAGLVLPALLFYFIYVEDRRAISPEDWTNDPHRTRLIQRYRTGLVLTEVVALLGYEVLLFALAEPQQRIGVLLLGQLPLGVLAAYGKLKRRPALDSFAVGGTWAFVIVFTVIVSSGRDITADAAAVFLAWFLIGFAGVESRNILDVHGDIEADKATLAGHLGRRRTTVLVGVLKAMGVAVFWWIAGGLVAGLSVGYLLLLRLLRGITKRERMAINRD